MNCEKCVQLLSDFYDGKLKDKDRALLDRHFNECLPCATTRQDLRAVISVAHELHDVPLELPNEKALWLRISNIIENENERTTNEAVSPYAPATESRSWWDRLTGKRWELTLPQLSTAVAAIVIAVTLLTTITIRGIQGTQAEDGLISSAVTGDRRTPAIEGTYIGSTPEDSLRRQQLTIDYWRQRVEQRKSRWNPQMREAFERNLKVLDQTVDDSLTELRSNPHDPVSEEMLNAALRDKMELLKEFSEL